MSKKSKKQKNKKKGFTLVELLAVIIILAIVVGITIPAVLTTTSNARKKAFQAAADSMANWIDRQYEIYKSGLDGTGLATLDPIFKSTCIRTCYNANCPGGTQLNNKSDFFYSKDKDSNGISNKCNCNCDNRVTFLTESIVDAAGLKSTNIDFDRPTTEALKDYNGIRIRHSSTSVCPVCMVKQNTNDATGSGTTYAQISKVYIDKVTGKSCVTLKASHNGDYPSEKVTCGGSCLIPANPTKWDKLNPNYCKPTI